MLTFKFVTALAVLLPFINAAPTPAPGIIKDLLDDIIDTPITLGGSTFKISQVLNDAWTPNGPGALAKALLKFNGTFPTSSAATSGGATSAAASGDTVAATPIDGFDSEYLCAVSIGTPPQTVNLDFDTGSSDLWVFSSETPSSEVNGQKLYDPYTSSSARNLTLANGATWSIGYADGSGSSGDVLLDTVTVGDVSVLNQAVESAKSVSSSFTATSASSGLLGLAFDSINKATPKVSTFFSNAIPELASPLFTANLVKGGPGNYNFGFIDSSEHTTDISYVPVDNSAGFWGFTISGFSVGKGASQTMSIPAIADTGTTLALLPDELVKAYYAQVTGAVDSSSAGGWTFPCDATLPDFTFETGSYKGVVPGSYLNYAPSGNACYGGIQSNAGIGFSIVGDVVLKSQFVVFDVGNTRLGFAGKKL